MQVVTIPKAAVNEEDHSFFQLVTTNVPSSALDVGDRAVSCADGGDILQITVPGGERDVRE